MRTQLCGLLFATAAFFSGCASNQPGNPGTAAQKTTSSWRWPDSLDAVKAAPHNHRVLYEDAKVRILDVTVQAGEKENLHYHRWPSIILIDSPAKKREYTSNGKVVLTDRPSAETVLPIIVRMGPTEPHAIENLDTNVLHLYRIELKQLDSTR